MKVLGGQDKTVGGLGAAGALAGTDILPIVQSGTTVRSTLADVKAFFDQGIRNASVSTPGAGFASDTYLVGSSCAIPDNRLQAKSMYRLLFSVAKTGAGTAAPVITVRVGTAGTTADTSRCAFTFPAQTAVIDEGVFQLWCTFRTVGSGTSAVIAGVASLQHDKGFGSTASTGLSVECAPTVVTVGGGFDSTVSNSIIGASVNGGTSAAWTIAVVQADLLNLT